VADYSLLTTHYIDSLLKAAPASLGSADAVVLLDRVQVSIDAGNNRTVERHCLVKVLNEQGRKDCGQVSNPFDQGQERLEVLLAQVHYPDGRVVPLDRSRISEVPVATEKEYAAARLSLIRFPDCPDGSVLEYRLRVSPRKPGRARPFSGLVPMGGYLPVLNKELAVSFPRGREFHWAQSVPSDLDPDLQNPGSRFAEAPASAPESLLALRGGVSLNPLVDTLGKTIRWVWISRQDSALAREPAEPALAQRVPQIVYSSYPTWRDVAETFRRQYAQALIPSVELKQKAHELAMGKPGSEAMRDIYRFVNTQIRTIDYSPLPAPYSLLAPHPATEVLKQGYGSQPDKACLLVSLLNAEGLNAYLLPVRTMGVAVIKDIPAPEAFDDILVVAFPDNNPAYLDPCSESQPYGRLPESVQGAEGLVLDQKNYRFVVLPKSDFDQNVAQVSGDITVQRDGSVNGTMTLKLTGAYDHEARAQLGLGPDARTEFAARLLELPDSGNQPRFAVTAVSETAGMAGPVVMSVSFSRSSTATGTLDHVTSVLPAPELALETLFALVQSSSRRTNLVVPPWRICRFICTVRPGDRVRMMPPGPTWTEENPCVRAACTWQPGTDGIEFRSEFLLKRTDLNPDDYQQLRSVVDEFRKPGLRELRISE
jgi:hypothetical protein